MIKEALRIPLLWTALGLVFIGAAVWFSYLNFHENIATPDRVTVLQQGAPVAR